MLPDDMLLIFAQQRGWVRVPVAIVGQSVLHRESDAAVEFRMKTRETRCPAGDMPAIPTDGILRSIGMAGARRLKVSITPYCFSVQGTTPCEFSVP